MDHWHPVLTSDELGEKPVGITLNSRELVVFRTKSGTIGVLDDECPHRRMRLSLGKVIDDRLQCPYHGWTFATDGAGESPGTPKLHAQHTCYDGREEYGAIWVKRAGSEAVFPAFEVDGFSFACIRKHVAEAPLELVVDNFTEVEHTSTTHMLLGYDLDGMSKVETRVESDDESVYVYNEGPQKKVWPPFKALLGFKKGDYFVDEWTTRFSPVYTRYDQWWFEPESRTKRKDHLRIYVFFNPITGERTELITFVYVHSRLGKGPLIRWVVAPVLQRLVDIEVNLDMDMLAQIVDKDPGIEGMRLSRFDKVLGLHRKRIDSVYRGINGAGQPDRTGSEAERSSVV